MPGLSTAAAELGILRALEPPGTLLHCARRVDADTPATDYEAEVEVERLNIDSTSYRAIRERCQDDPQRIAETIAEIVAEHGKLQNPWTGSGGVLMGRLGHVGARYCVADLRPGQRIDRKSVV